MLNVNSMALLNNQSFINWANTLICSEASSGNVLWLRNGALTFDPLLAGDKVIAVVGNKLLAYR